MLHNPMIETVAQQAKRLKAEAAMRQERSDAYERKMNLGSGVEAGHATSMPSVSPQGENRDAEHVERPVVQTNRSIGDERQSRGSSVPPTQKLPGKKRDAKWWRDYRKRPKKCPHCGGEI